MWVMQEIIRIIAVAGISMIIGGWLQYHTQFYTRMINWLARGLDKIC
jgi:ABC-type tungstate transport system substrate-binding protein